MGASFMVVFLTIMIHFAEDSNTQNTSDCGVAPLNTRIVGGSNAPSGSWPWQVSMHYNGRHICGGTLIHPEWVMTAAHCILSKDTTKWTLYLGRESQSGANPHEVSRGVQAILVHPNYNNTLYNNDITLMRLSVPVSFTDYIRPVCLASNSSFIYNATSCWATGWGNIAQGVSLAAPQTLQEVEVPVVGSKECTCQYGQVEGALITAQMICAGTGGKGACQGDSGGPLQCKQGSLWIQAGIASYGVPCATPAFPEVYTRVSEFQMWVTQNVAGASIGFATFSSAGEDGGSNYTCKVSVVSAATPHSFFTSSLLVLLYSLIPSVSLTLTLSGAD